MFETRSVGIQPSGQVRRVGMHEPYRHRRRIRREKARARMRCCDAQCGGIMKVAQLLIEAPMSEGVNIDVYCRAQARTTTSGTHRGMRSSSRRLHRTAPITYAACFGGFEPSEGQSDVRMKQESNVVCQCDVDACRQKVQRCQMGMGPKVRKVKRTWESEDRRFSCRLMLSRSRPEAIIIYSVDC